MNRPAATPPAGTADLPQDTPYVLMKRGLYWCPNGKGYTGVLAKAGRYSEQEARGWSGHGDGTTAHLASDCTEFSPACWPETQIELLRAERATLAAENEALRAALTDPVAVHVNMLAGKIAKPSIANIIHLYGADALRTALAQGGSDAA